MKIGYHCEGWDHLILHCLVCRLLGLEEDAVQACPTQAGEPMSFEKVLFLAENALRKFYFGQWAAAVVVAVDNDGQRDLNQAGRRQDDNYPRHWVHREDGEPWSEKCRTCRLKKMLGSLRPQLDAPGFVPGLQWPVVICVPVEAIEAWLLTARSLLQGAPKSYEDRPAGTPLKQLFYGSARATRSRVEDTALPLRRQLPDVHAIGRYSKSFRRFAWHVRALRRRILSTAALRDGAWSASAWE